VKQCNRLTLSMKKKNTDCWRVNDLCMNGVLVLYRIRVCFCACVTKGGSENISTAFYLLSNMYYVISSVLSCLMSETVYSVS
jgi:hypothetical protein